MNGTLALDLGSSTTVVAWQAPGESPRLLPLPPLRAALTCGACGERVTGTDVSLTPPREGDAGG